MKDTSIVLAAGGTGGHIFPAQALAEELKSRGFGKIYLVTDERFKKYCSNFSGIEVLTVSTGSLSGGVIQKAVGVLRIIKGFFQARKILAGLPRAVVIGFGGYPSFPTMCAAVSLKRKTIIHEQNAFAGEVNKLLARVVTAIATSYPDTHGFFDDEIRRKITMVGNPVRPAIMKVREKSYPVMGKLSILVTGGSQGASVFSRVVPAAIELLPDNMKSRLVITQQCRADDIDAVKIRYGDARIDAEVSSFFDNMAERLAGAHLVICRAGASSIAELFAAGRPAILVPFAAAKDNHQAVNAKSAEERGGLEVMLEAAFTPEALASRLEWFMNNPSELQKMVGTIMATEAVNSAAMLADVVEGVLNHG